MDEQFIMVSMGQLVVSARPGDTLAALGLGSCVAVCAYDPFARVGGMIHVVLPSSAIGRPGDPPAKFADQGVPRLIEALAQRGGLRSRLRIAMLGGANVLSFTNHNGALDIGARNVAGIREALESERLTCHASDVGGKISRTVRLRVDSGEVTIKTIRGGCQPFARLGERREP
jgi:chemotaxis protein CheD